MGLILRLLGKQRALVAAWAYATMFAPTFRDMCECGKGLKTNLTVVPYTVRKVMCVKVTL